MKYVSLIILSLLFYSCLYKAGNRQPDINQSYDVSISPFYIKKYMKNLDSFYANRMLITSEIVNYPNDFIPVTDSLLGFKYVIGFDDFDSIKSIDRHYLDLTSIYDFKKKRWVTDRDSLTNGELEKFKLFFRDSVLAKTVQYYKNKIPDSLLFVEKSRLIAITPLK